METCHCILKTGINKGKRCTFRAKYGLFCGVHSNCTTSDINRQEPERRQREERIRQEEQETRQREERIRQQATRPSPTRWERTMFTRLNQEEEKKERDKILRKYEQEARQREERIRQQANAPSPTRFERAILARSR